MTPPVNTYDFAADELRIISDSESSLKSPEEWPADSPLAFLRNLTPKQRGNFGEDLIRRAAQADGLLVGEAESTDYDLFVAGNLLEIKLSTCKYPLFQQIRHPLNGDGSYTYDWLICISARPEGLVYWAINADAVETMMGEGGEMRRQHSHSDVFTLNPSRSGDGIAGDWRTDYDGLMRVLRSGPLKA